MPLQACFWARGKPSLAQGLAVRLSATFLWEQVRPSDKPKSDDPATKTLTRLLAPVISSVISCLGEMTALMPVNAPVMEFSRRFVSRGVGFAVGWVYWFVISAQHTFSAGLSITAVTDDGPGSPTPSSLVSSWLLSRMPSSSATRMGPPPSAGKSASASTTPCGLPCSLSWWSCSTCSLSAYVCRAKGQGDLGSVCQSMLTLSPQAFGELEYVIGCFKLMFITMLIMVQSLVPNLTLYPPLLKLLVVDVLSIRHPTLVTPPGMLRRMRY